MKLSNYSFLLLSVFYLSSIRHAFCQIEYLDKSFGVDGIVNQSGIAHTSLLQADDKVIVGGSIFENVLNRFNIDGSLDSSFHLFNARLTDPTSIGTLVEQKDGKILASGGSYSSADRQAYSFLYRFKPDGSLDSTFGPHFLFGVLSTIIQNDDKIILASISKGKTYLTRLENNGKRDVYFKFASIQGTFLNMVRTLDDKIILAVRDFDLRNYFLMKFTNEGVLDSSFGLFGKYLLPYDYDVPFTNDSYIINGIASQDDGKIVIIGTKSGDFNVIRVNANGSIDSSFNNGGIQSIDFGEGDDVATSVAIQKNGRIIVAGYSMINSINFNGRKIAVAALKTDGSLDEDFANQGKFYMDILVAQKTNQMNLRPYDILIQTDDKIVISGTADVNYNNNQGFFILRLLNDINVSSDNKDKNVKGIVFYPNPVDQDGRLEYNLLKEQMISIRLIDLKGEVIMTYVKNVKQEAGRHQQKIALPESIVNGIYFISISTPGNNTMIKIVK